MPSRTLQFTYHMYPGKTYGDYLVIMIMLAASHLGTGT